MRHYILQANGKPKTGWDGNANKSSWGYDEFVDPEKLTTNQRQRIKRSVSKARRRSDAWWIEKGLFEWEYDEVAYIHDMCYWGSYYVLPTEDGDWTHDDPGYESMGAWINIYLDMDYYGEREQAEWCEEHKTEGGWSVS